ncbi:ABC transporter permease [Tranquillimonas alkanivorans]|uniref:Oligopeptide transport system permease protein OppC n=1 Tax=Tranquillimonas alkanivorans TaxID=441119 RepID=A0A1I5RY83_9RHOB|nr:ABC transporter permease subunit [Tranquillimonas alkanivorans]SFP63469.1 oligopeptide transport system permease protein [Tranquillimonas alkanivorans]
MTDLATNTPEVAAGSRSLWAVAMIRMRRNRAAMASLVILIVLALAGIFGPMLAPHSYAEVYPEFVKVDPSLEPYPQEAQIIPSAETALRRARVDIESIEVGGGEVVIGLSSSREIDPRITRYVDRSDVFSNAEITEIAEDGLSATMVADVQQLYFLMGTDANGRDLFSRILISLRISLMIGALATGVALLIGVLYGATAGFVGGRVDNVMMRIVDILYSLPFVFFVILLVVFFGRNLVLMFIAVGAVEWLDMARIVRGQTLSLRRREFVQAAETLGVSGWDILRRHIIPNTLGTVIIYMTLLIPKVILLESFLSFLGLGVQEPLTSLGVLIAEGAKNMRNAPFMLFYPAATMTILLFALNFLGDGLRDALDPKDR